MTPVIDDALEVYVSPRNRTLSLLGSIAVAGVLATGLGACSDEPERADSGEVSEAGDESVFDINVGDCLSTNADGSVTEVPLVPCAEPHESEVYHSYTIPGEEFPADDAMQTIAGEQCVPAFQTFVGKPYQESALEFTTLQPTSESWGQGDRELLCLVVDPAGNVTGSLRGANR